MHPVSGSVTFFEARRVQPFLRSLFHCHRIYDSCDCICFIGGKTTPFRMLDYQVPVSSVVNAVDFIASPILRCINRNGASRNF
jgi:hypothetical protein